MTVERNNMATVKAAAASYPYIEDVFSTYLYTGTGATRSITNNIDLSTNGGLTWIKVRDQFESHCLFDTVRGATKFVYSNAAAGNQTVADTLTAFNTNGFSLGADAGAAAVNYSGWNFASWTFRKQAKFFDVVSYTGTGSATTIAHNLGATPGMIIVKRTDTTANWRVYHSGLTSASYYMALNTTAAQALDTTIWNATAPTSSVFSVGTDATVNASGGTYIAYIYASNAGGFGSAGTDNVITCGSFTTSGSGTATVTLGYEPQYLLIKPSSAADNWYIAENMRGLSLSDTNTIYAQTTGTETSWGLGYFVPTATGFQIIGLLGNSKTCVYMAIRRGPMKTPTSGTSVYSPILSSAAAGTAQTTNFVVDTQIAAKQTGADGNRSAFMSRLTGNSSTTSESSVFKITSSTSTLEQTSPATLTRYWNNTGFQNPTYYASTSSIYWSFGRAPGFHDVVCYTGTGSATTITHNLGVVPELIICVKRTNSSAASTFPTPVYCSGLTSASYYVELSRTTAESLDTTYWNATAPTSSVFSVGTSAQTNSGGTYVAYLFATLSGVSKVGTYTGTAAALNIDCGFAAGARFVMIKRINSTGSWYVYDTARGINASGTNDPYIVFNTASAEVTNTDYLATYSSGFALTSSGSATVNVSGSTYIYLAIA